MKQGSTPAIFVVPKGSTVLIRVVAVGGGQFDTVAGADLFADPGHGHVYRLVTPGQAKKVKRVAIGCMFPEEMDPPAKYRFEVWQEGEEKVFKPLRVLQPSGGDFPTTVTIALEFETE